MPQLSLLERARVLRLAAGRVRRKGMARALASPLLRWRYGAPIAEALALVPQELRPADPAVADEIERGQLGLAGATVTFRKASPFDVPPPSAAWARALHGFEWLRHLRAADTEEATVLARGLVAAWIGHGGARAGIARQPDVAGRRMISWLSNADLLLEGVEQATFDRTTQCLGDQLIDLSATWSSTAEGQPRLLAMLGVVYGDLCIIGHERHLAVSEGRLAAELARQILPDGGHASRNASVLLELMLDLVPLRQCYTTLQRKLPAEIESAMGRMMRMLHAMRLGEGSLARFNGVGAPAIAELSTVLAYDHAGQAAPLLEPLHSGYARLEAGGLVAIADAGDPPPLALAGQAQAGALSFELSSGAQAILVNGGMPGPAEASHLAAARGSASHNVFCLGERSSARLLRHVGIEDLVGGEPIRALGPVSARMEQSDAGILLDASFDGYMAEHALRYSRRLMLTADGSRCEGGDRLAGVRGPVRLARDVPFAVRFHLHPMVECGGAGADGSFVLSLCDGQRWRFHAAGASASLEPSLHYADPSGVARSRQIVLRGACWGETAVDWRLERAA